jgi:hypothetical protein
MVETSQEQGSNAGMLNNLNNATDSMLRDHMLS